MAWISTVLVCLMSLALIQCQQSVCPNRCICFRQHVRCMYLQMDRIPRIPEDTRVLDLRFNKIKYIPENAFSGLVHLETILLNNNLIKEIPDGAVNSLPDLKHLYLYKNHIEKIGSRAFQTLPKLEQLYLHDNKLKIIGHEAFTHLPSLRRLFLHHNKIRKLPRGVFNDTPNLKRLRLDSNPIECDCQMIWLKEMLKDTQDTQAAVTCRYPEKLRGRSLASIGAAEFECEMPHFTLEPRDVDVAEGNTVYFSCKAEGVPDPQIEWLHNNIVINPDEGRFNILDDGTLKIENTQDSDQGEYECRARNLAGEAKTNKVELRYFGDPVAPAFINTPNDVLTKPGKRIKLVCAASGNPRPDISWLKDNRLLRIDAQHTISPLGTLVIDDIDIYDHGTYTCKASNTAGSVVTEATVTVQVQAQLVTRPEDQTVVEGETVSFSCRALGNPPPPITWLKDGGPLPDTFRWIHYDDGRTLHNIRTILEDMGIYTCRIPNGLDYLEASAELIVTPQTVPVFTKALEDVEVNPGESVGMECTAEAEPSPNYQWIRYGITLFNNDKYHVQDDKLLIRNITKSDEGFYECRAANLAGVVQDGLRLRVRESGIQSHLQDDQGILFLNFSIPSGVSLKFETACNMDPIAECNPVAVVSGEDTPAVEKTMIELFDSSLPEVPVYKGDKFVDQAIKEAKQRVNSAINDTMRHLFDRSRTHTVSDLLQIFRYPNAEALELARAEEIFEQTLEIIQRHVEEGHNYNLQGHDLSYEELISPSHLLLISEMAGCHTEPVAIDCSNICYHKKYRTVDGTCNNMRHPKWGASNMAFGRLVKPIYENGFNTPVGWNKAKLYNGVHLPSPRLVSSLMMSSDHVTGDEKNTHMLMQWGQFIDHDMDLTPQSVSYARFSDGTRCNETCEDHFPCFPISVPTSDQRIHGRRCLGFARSSATCNSGSTSIFFQTFAPREQINSISSYIDASNVYGSTTEHSEALRDDTNDRGLLKAGTEVRQNKRLLPYDSIGAIPSGDCQIETTKRHVPCFLAGDHRANEQLSLTAMHTMWMREHNRIARELLKLNPHWDGDMIFHETRKIIGGIFQHITYTHWLPNILGPRGMELLRPYSGYNSEVDSTIVNEFATAALRFGHSLIQPVMFRLNESMLPIPEGNLPLHKAFFSPYKLLEEGGIDPLLRGMFGVAAKKRMPDEFLNVELTEKLFALANAVGQDLASLNIQRGRDHGLPFYNQYRKYCNLTVAERFSDFREEITHTPTRLKLQSLYSHPDNVDLFVGGMSETPVEGAKIGPTFLCILAEQFRKLRDGDRFWYENPGVFTPEQLVQVKQSSLARAICDSSDNIQQVQTDVFKMAHFPKDYKSCSEIPAIDLNVWADCCTDCRKSGDFKSITSHFKGGDFSYKSDTSVNSPLTSATSESEETLSSQNTIDNAISENPAENDYLADKMDVLDTRIEGMENVVTQLQKTIKFLKRKMRKMEGKMGDHKTSKTKFCKDEKGKKRSHREKWKVHDCRSCTCTRGQIDCESQMCPLPECLHPKKIAGHCCPTC